VWRDIIKNYAERFERQRDEERDMEEIRTEIWKVV